MSSPLLTTLSHRPRLTWLEVLSVSVLTALLTARFCRPRRFLQVSQRVTPRGGSASGLALACHRNRTLGAEPQVWDAPRHPQPPHPTDTAPLPIRSSM